jgi:putative Mn2+ efflux pump MntP
LTNRQKYDIFKEDSNLYEPFIMKPSRIVATVLLTFLALLCVVALGTMISTYLSPSRQAEIDKAQSQLKLAEEQLSIADAALKSVASRELIQYRAAHEIWQEISKRESTTRMNHDSKRLLRTMILVAVVLAVSLLSIGLQFARRDTPLGDW